MSSRLKSGYTTGVYASATLKGVLAHYCTRVHETYTDVPLPNGAVAHIRIQEEKENEGIAYITQKGHNDDPDVTKGCWIVATLSHSKHHFHTHPIPHHPYRIPCHSHTVSLYAGTGVGVVTKKGLKAPPGYPAINPIPLRMMDTIIQTYAPHIHHDLQIRISVKQGEEIAQNTANAKVGVLGGISILGTTGIVKPISNDAFLHSIHTELSVAAAEGYDAIILTLGESAYQNALQRFDTTQVVEIGNFIYDSCQFLNTLPFKKIHFIAGAGKMAKVAQGFQNTHNRYGTIDFQRIATWIQEGGMTMPQNLFDCITLRGIMETLETAALKAQFTTILTQKATHYLKTYLPNKRHNTTITAEIVAT
jgi:cobalt-precorrin-5B (C1)-methyltransferase